MWRYFYDVDRQRVLDCVPPNRAVLGAHVDDAVQVQPSCEELRTSLRRKKLSWGG